MEAVDELTRPKISIPSLIHQESIMPTDQAFTTHSEEVVLAVSL
jgi:hypothetical protein